MRFIVSVCFILLFTACASTNKALQKKLKPFYVSGFAQGTTYHITYYAADSFVNKNQFDSIFRSIDTSLSIYKPFSIISRFNDDAEKVLMDYHMKQVIKRSLEIYKNTNGIFDITVYPLVRAWGFGNKKLETAPDSALIKSILPCVGSDKIEIDNDYLVKKDPCVKIDVNGIAQGYTVDVIADFLEKNGIKNYLVEVGGEIRVKGKKYPSGDLFQIGIESPSENEFEEAPIKLILQTDKGAVTTSGNYRRFYESNGKIISHLINPKTGYSLQNELISVTVYAKDAMTADGYDNALMGMGLLKAMNFVEKQKGMEAHFIYHDGKGNVSDTATAGFYKLLKK